MLFAHNDHLGKFFECQCLGQTSDQLNQTFWGGMQTLEGFKGFPDDFNELPEEAG